MKVRDFFAFRSVKKHRKFPGGPLERERTADTVPNLSASAQRKRTLRSYAKSDWAVYAGLY